MKKRVAHLAFVLGIVGAVSIGCGTDDDGGTSSNGGTGAVAGKAGAAGTAGKGGSAGKAGSAPEGGSAGEPSLPGSAGSAGSEQAGAGGSAGETAGSGPGGEGGSAGEGPVVYSPEQIDRGKVIVRSIALCGGCHTASTGSELGGNPAFFSNLGAPNLTDDATGIGGFSDARVINAFRNGIALRKFTDTDSIAKDRHLNSVMPYWLFHNLSDDDALAIVAFLRSLPPATAVVDPDKPDATAVTPLAPSSFPDTSLPSTSPDYAAAQQGKYLLSGVAQCVKCHSTASGGLPAASFFSGVAPANGTTIFASNITPDVTGIAGWTAADVVTALKVGTNKAGTTLCGSMPSAGKGYGGISDTEAFAIGVYLTSIPAVSKPTADPALEPACPP